MVDKLLLEKLQYSDKICLSLRVSQIIFNAFGNLKK